MEHPHDLAPLQGFASCSDGPVEVATAFQDVVIGRLLPDADEQNGPQATENDARRSSWDSTRQAGIPKQSSVLT